MTICPEGAVTVTAGPAKPPALDGTGTLGSLNARITAGGASRLMEAVRTYLLPCGLPLAVDIETFGLGTDGRRIKCVAVAVPSHVVVFDPRDPDQARALRYVLGEARELIFHNAAYDVPNLYVNQLWDIRWCSKVTDTMIYARLSWPDVLTSKSLEPTAERVLGVTSESSVKTMFKRLGLSLQDGYRRTDTDTPAFLMGNAIDAVLTTRLLVPLRARAFDTVTSGHPFSSRGVTGDEARRLVEREQRINREITLPRACRGIRVDLDYPDRYLELTGSDRATALAVLTEHGIRPGNATDLVTVLDRLGAVPASHPRTPKTGRLSTAKAHLDRLRHPIATAFVTVKEHDHVFADYVNKAVQLADGHGRIHPQTNLLAATTGRASMGDPPLHQFSGPARGVLLADEGDTLTSIDWSQIEPVVVANIAGDLGALAAYEAGTGDMYTTVAEFATVPRKTAKVTLLAQLYGEGIAKLAADLDVDVDTARDIRVTVFRALPRTQRFVYLLRDIGERYRKIITVSGRVIDIPMGKGFDGGPPTVATHKAVNYTVQGSAYDVLAETLILVADAGLADAVYLTMHDELVVSTDAATEIERIMRTPPEALCRWAGRVPVLRTDRADLGQRWAAA